MTDIKVDCLSGHSPRLKASEVVIDDSEEVYRFTCRTCGVGNEKVMTDRIRSVLRSAGCATIEELVGNAGMELRTDENIWEALEMS